MASKPIATSYGSRPETVTTRKHRATISFAARQPLPRWTGSGQAQYEASTEWGWTHTWVASLNSSDVAIDQEQERSGWAGASKLYGVDPRFECKITSRQHSLLPEADGHTFQLVVQGAGPGGRRYSTFRTLTAAQEAAIKWAARRFYYLNDDQRSEHEDRVRDLGSREARRILRQGVPNS